jgi:phosphohistidine phosphatase
MARQLWLLRHADAEPHGTRPDAERRLTERGERQARSAGRALARMEIEPDAILTSPKERALRTATLVLEAWAGERSDLTGAVDLIRTHSPLREGFDGAQALAAIEPLGPDGRLLAVGHEPDLSNVVAELTGARIDLKKGGLVVVRIAAMVAREPQGSSAGAGGELVLLLRPAELALIAALDGADV